MHSKLEPISESEEFMLSEIEWIWQKRLHDWEYSYKYKFLDTGYWETERHCKKCGFKQVAELSYCDGSPILKEDIEKEIYYFEWPPEPFCTKENK